MERRLLRRLAGVRDLSEGDYRLLKEAQERLQHLFSLYDYRTIDTPLLEETELFLRKAGGGIGTRIYTFTDPGGHKVSLRPEFTSSIIRYYLQRQDREPLPVRWQYAGPVFRFEPLSPGVYRQFTQVGAELLGASGPEADAEIIALAWHGLSSLGLCDHQLHIGHVGVLHELLKEYQLSDRAREFLAANMTRLGSGAEGRQEVQRRAQELGLLAQVRRAEGKPVLEGLDNEAARGMAQMLLREGVADAAVGRRTPEDIFARFLRKVRGSDDPAKVEDAMAFLAQLAQVKGSPHQTLKEAKEVARGHGLGQEHFEQVEHLVQALGRHGLDGDHINLDFGLARGLSYYSGVIFEVLHPWVTSEVSLGGGGRYDGLVKDLGGSREIPALGFAYHLERVLDVLEATKGEERPASTTNRILLVPQTSGAYHHALRLAGELRSRNGVVRLGFSCSSLQECLGYASLIGIDRVVVVDEKGHTREYPVKASPGAKRENVATSLPK